MSLQFLYGDLLADDADALVNTVNCQGFMGKGVALAFARDRRFKSRQGALPKWGLEADYKERLRRGELHPGEPYVYVLPTASPTLLEPIRPRFVINFPTKDSWRASSRLEWITAGLRRLPGLVDHYGIQSMAMPPVGCGFGGLNWNVVRHEIELALADVAIPIRVYLPLGEHDDESET